MAFILAIGVVALAREGINALDRGNDPSHSPSDNKQRRQQHRPLFRGASGYVHQSYCGGQCGGHCHDANANANADVIRHGEAEEYYDDKADGGEGFGEGLPAYRQTDEVAAAGRLGA
ncbi:hypothetical protein LTR36_003310 [Oleoguttula mirabilis]|uniref:Uncharacterized protein n=1 Tax=Oleoguttula mirabilis TaxID=1507867 RepID=A0AAV9JXJ8_9PEZI|nr:hypothetical protein LTR36_003310 [Oleoguttula mirabilis]